LESKIKIGLILILVGITMFMLSILFRIFGLSFLPFVLILGGMIVMYVGLSQRGRGIMLNIIGFVVSFITGMIIFLIDI